jgi:tetratricopeptide (TPR) repeat protein
VREADWERVEELGRKGEGEDFDSLFWRPTGAYFERDTAAQAAFERKVLEARDSSGLRGAMYAAFTVHDLDAIRRLTELEGSSIWPEAHRSRAARSQRYAGLMGGRWNTADGGACPASNPERMGVVVCGLLPFLTPPDGALEALRERVAGWDSVPPAVAEENPDSALKAHARLYVLGSIDAALGRTEAALDAAARLERLPTIQRWEPTVRALANTIRGQVALRQGRAEEALSVLPNGPGVSPPELVNHPLFAREIERLWRGEALYAAGRDEEALTWFEDALAWTFHESIYDPFLTLRRAELLDRLGRTDEAAEAYSRFLQMWPEPDPGLKPLVEDARQRLATLRQEGGR